MWRLSFTGNLFFLSGNIFIALEPGLIIPDEDEEENDDDWPIISEVKDFSGDIVITSSPNPFTDQVKIIIETGMKGEINEMIVEIFDMTGRKVKEFGSDYFTSQDRIEIIWDGNDETGKNLKPGTYLIIVKNRTGKKVLKLMKI